MHHKGAKIVKCGASMDQLIGSVCFEMHPNEVTRAKQIQFNKDLEASSSGLMCPLTGGERYLTVSSTHTSQFCKALLHGCQTPEGSLKDSKGNLSLDMLGKDLVLKEMASVGWEWLVIPWYVEEAFPKLPAMIADALNSVNGIFEAQGELELALTIANSAVGAATFEWDDLATSCCTSPQVVHYAKWIGKLVKNLGGGKDQGYPLIKFAQEFQKQFGNSCFVGRDFFISLLDTDLMPTNMTVFVKIALLATQVSAPENKRVDGFSRFLSRGDLQQLKAKKMHPMVMEAETMLAKSWDAIGKTILANYDKNKFFGRLCIRTACHLLKKQKVARDNTEFADLAAIEQAFKDEMQAGIQQQPTKDPTDPKKESAVSLQDGQSPMFMAGLKLDLKVGYTYMHKDHANMIFIMEKLENEKAYLSHKDLLSGKETTLELDANQVLDSLKVTKQKIGIVISGNTLAQAFPSVKCHDELAKASIYQQLFQAYEANDTDENYIQCLAVPGKGVKVHAVQSIKKHDLVFVPMCEGVHALQYEEPKSKLWASGIWEGKKFWILPPKIGKEPAESTLVPFFLMKEIEDGQMVPYQLEFNKVKVMCLRNNKPIDKHAEIGLPMAEANEPKAKKRKVWPVAYSLDAFAWQKIAYCMPFFAINTTLWHCHAWHHIGTFW